LKYLSVCSGIEAATVAWHSLGWEAAGFSEIEKFPSEVLKHHYPNVTNFGDMTKYKEWNLGTIELLVGGTPCQSFSVAGLRKGLEDPRGNLMLTYCGLLDHFKPKWFVWENVPGVLSSSGGRDFGSFLGAVAELGYGWAYRVLDAQYFGVAQRRRRVFVVGCLGDWESAAKVLFEPESLRGNPPPSRKQRQETAATITARFGASRNNHEECVVYENHPSDSRVKLMGDVCQTVTSSWGTGGGNTPFVQAIALAENTIGRQPQNGGNGDGFTEGGPMYTLNATGVHGVAYSFDSLASNSMKSKNPDSGCRQVELSKTLNTTVPDPSKNQGGLGIVQAIDMYNLTINQKTTQTLRGNGSIDHVGGVLQSQNISVQAFDTYNHSLSDVNQTIKSPQGGVNESIGTVIAPTLTTNDPSRSPQSSEVTQQVNAVYQASMAVRRLTPVECERLQGFPDNYTDIKPKGKDTPDGPRYKALGNSMAVPVMAWIGKRIQMVEDES